MKSKFTGGIIEMIGISVLSALITAFTFGLAAPWAVCMYQRWLTNHTIVDGKQLHFDGTGMQLFGNYIKWFLLTLVTFGIYGFWLTIKMQQWIVSHTHIIGEISEATAE